jgi:hypothetical protein
LDLLPKNLDPAMVGAIGLVIAAAALVGYLVARALAGYPGSSTFGMLAAFAFTAALAYAGVQAAAMIMWVMLVGLLLVWVATLLMNS